MKIGLLLGDIAMVQKYDPGIFAPRGIFLTLTEELIHRGHQVFLSTSPEIAIATQNISGDIHLSTNDFELDKKPEQKTQEYYHEVRKYLAREYELELVTRFIQYANEEQFDILHDFGCSDITMHLNRFIKVPLLLTLHNAVPHKDTLTHWRFQHFHNLHYSFLSQSQKDNFEQEFGIESSNPIPNGININNFSFQDKTDANNMIFAGRYIMEKGVDIALKVALKLKIPLKLASSNLYHETTYYKQSIKPHLRPDLISEIYFSDSKSKNQFYQNAKLLLFPIQWEEPFGLVIIESMASGTPVIAFAKGAVPEVIKDGETGFIVNSSDDDIRGEWIIKKTGIEGLCEAIEKIYSMPEEEYKQMRQNSRKHVEENFTVERMVDEYEKVYKKIVASNT